MDPPVVTKNNWPGSRTGRDLSTIASRRLKIAVFAPMPSASVSTATAVKPGFFNNWRKANLRSFITQRLHRINAPCAPCRQPAGEDQRRQDAQRHSNERQRIERTDSSELVTEEPGRAE